MGQNKSINIIFISLVITAVITTLISIGAWLIDAEGFTNSFRVDADADTRYTLATSENNSEGEIILNGTDQSINAITLSGSGSTSVTSDGEGGINIYTEPCVDNIFPVGSIYMSANSQNPEETLGGEWVSWGSGKVPVGVDSLDTDFDAAEKTGGEKSHKMTEAENGPHYHAGPLHTHGPGSGARFLNYTGTLSAETVGAIEGSGQKLAQILSGGSDVWYGGTATAAAGNGNTGISGSGTAHNNLQPYITCYMWKRIN
jgi:hypothetical protein